MRKQSLSAEDPIKREEGMKIMVYIRKNHVNPNIYPYKKLFYYVVYGQGVETVFALMDKGLANGTIRKSGAWIYFTDPTTSEEMQWNGKAAFREALLSNPELMERVKNAVGGLIENITEEEKVEMGIIDDEKAEKEYESKPED